MKSHKSINRRTRKNSLARTRKTKHSNAKRIYKKSHRGGSITNPNNPITQDSKLSVSFNSSTKPYNGPTSLKIYKFDIGIGTDEYNDVLSMYPFIKSFIETNTEFISSYDKVLDLPNIQLHDYSNPLFTNFFKKIVDLANQYHNMINDIKTSKYSPIEENKLAQFIEGPINTILKNLYEIITHIINYNLINPLELNTKDLYDNAFVSAQETNIKNPDGTVSHSEIANAFLILLKNSNPIQLIYNINKNYTPYNLQ